MLFFRKLYFAKFKNYIDNSNILLILWARQVGKTSFVYSLINEWFIKNFVFLNGEEFLWKDYLPRDFYDFLRLEYNIETKNFLIIDEAQNINNIWIILKYLVDMVKLGKLKIKIIVLGSGSLSLFRWFTDSLIGRYDVIKIYPLSFEEFLDYSKNFETKLAFDKSSNLSVKNVENFGKNIVLVIGPEGGFSEGEVKKLKERNFIIANLGKFTLRSETASLVAISFVLSKLL